ncbi:tetratricopeptide repeat protein [Planococcus sp. CAU13]|uniref:tetratricopeptide repeat protein n=1 Tax=Planococcus sp. CAU13 TaxID=1541197 RepID=UPI00068F0F49|nr:tetratricopeptide repeat protein [Planococcus sp. CAU13]
MKKINEAFDLFEQGEFEKAEAIYLACLEDLADGTSDAYKAILYGLGYVKSHQGEMEKAKQYFNEVREIAAAEADKKEEAMALHQMGMVERMAGEYEKALRLFTAEAEIWKRHFPDFHIGFSANCYERGYIALKQKQHEEASRLLQTSLEYAKAANDPVAEGCAYRGLGEIELVKRRIDQAKVYFQQARSSFEEAGDALGVAEIQEFLKHI